MLSAVGYDGEITGEGEVMQRSIGRAIAIVLLSCLATAVFAATPKDVKRYRKLSEQASKAQGDGNYKKLAKLLGRQAALAPEDSSVHYNLACARALKGDSAGALEALAAAVETGWTDAEHAGQDSDLESLRGLARFDSLLEGMEQNEADWKERTRKLHTELDPASAPAFQSVEDLNESFSTDETEFYALSALYDMDTYYEKQWALHDHKIAALKRYIADHPEADDRDAAGIEVLRTALAYNEYRDPWGMHDGPWAHRQARWFLDTFSDSEHRPEAMLIAGQARMMSAPEEGEVEETAADAENRRRQAEGYLGALIAEHSGSTAAAKACMWRMRIAYERSGRRITSEVKEHYEAFCAACGEDDDVLDYAWEKARSPLFELERDDFRGTDLEGNEVTLNAMEGKVVLVDFWATWCGPCIRELPHLKDAYARYAEQGFEIIGVSLDDDDRDAFLEELEDREIPWPQIYDGKGWEAELAQRYRVKGIPTMILLDRRGKVVDLDVRGEALVERIGELVGETGANAGAGSAP